MISNYIYRGVYNGVDISTPMVKRDWYLFFVHMNGKSGSFKTVTVEIFHYPRSKWTYLHHWTKL